MATGGADADAAEDHKERGQLKKQPRHLGKVEEEAEKVKRAVRPTCQAKQGETQGTNQGRTNNHNSTASNSGGGWHDIDWKRKMMSP